MDKQNEESSENFPDNHDMAKDNEMFQALIQPRQSQPTKNKVKNFKNRIFQLLIIYADKCQNVNTLLGCLKQEMFIRQPQKMRQLVNIVLNKQNITIQMLQQLAQHYKVMLLYKAKKGTNQLAEDFVRIIRKILSLQQNNSQEILKDMLKSFAYKRKCKIHADFFFYFLRKVPSLKQSIIQECDLILKDINLRPAQKKQVQKLKLKLLKKQSQNKQSVKKEQKEQQSESNSKNKKVNKINQKTVPQKLTSSLNINSKNQNSMEAEQKKNIESKKSYKKDARKKNKKDNKNVQKTQTIHKPQKQKQNNNHAKSVQKKPSHSQSFNKKSQNNSNSQQKKSIKPVQNNHVSKKAEFSKERKKN